MVIVAYFMVNESTDWILTKSEILAVAYAVSYSNFKSISILMNSYYSFPIPWSILPNETVCVIS